MVAGTPIALAACSACAMICSVSVAVRDWGEAAIGKLHATLPAVLLLPTPPPLPPPPPPPQAASRTLTTRGSDAREWEPDKSSKGFIANFSHTGPPVFILSRLIPAMALSSADWIMLRKVSCRGKPFDGSCPFLWKSWHRPQSDTSLLDSSLRPVWQSRQTLIPGISTSSAFLDLLAAWQSVQSAMRCLVWLNCDCVNQGCAGMSGVTFHCGRSRPVVPCRPGSPMRLISWQTLHDVFSNSDIAAA